ncbi:mismatch-specific DNA-glycosylase [Phosphitispora sp. TUW77]|uniref:mismatch-specific DNA-glycosylase n=1 Tax=Phosphitispora sp. TUW77 TaxID=3152361 RepID=UPI003AB6D58D
MLPDVLKDGMKIIFCSNVIGETTSADCYYYSSPGNKFWDILHRTCLTPFRIDPGNYKDVTLYGLGLTDYNFNRDELIDKIKTYKTQVLCFNGKKAAKSFCAKRDIVYGFQDVSIGKTRIFVAPSTSANAHKYWDEKWWHLLADSVGSCFTKVSIKNYFEPDEICKSMENIDFATGTVTRTTENDFVRAVADIELHCSIPLYIKNIFEISKALFAYGYLYYPFCTVAVEQALKSLEAIISKKYEVSGGPRVKNKGRYPVLSDKINYLYAKGLVSEQQREILHDFRHLRNITVHPKYQQILGHYDGMLRALAHLMNEIWLAEVKK